MLNDGAEVRHRKMRGIVLSEGMRVGLRVDDERTCVAVIRSVNGRVIDLGLLEELQADELVGTEITIFVPHAEGLSFWPADTPVLRPPDHLTLRLAGPSQVLQRRRYQRYSVDLTAQLRPVRQGRSARRANVTVIDLSRGGAKVSGTVQTMTGDTVMFTFDVGDGPLSTAATVTMSYPDNDGRRVSHLAFARPEEPTPGMLGLNRYLDALAAEIEHALAA